MDLKHEVAEYLRERLAGLSDDELIDLMLKGTVPQGMPKPVPITSSNDPQLPDTKRDGKPKRERRPADPKDEQTVFNAIKKECRGLSMGEICDISGLKPGRVRTILGALCKSTGPVFRSGEKRFCRYATSASAARRAALLARGKDPGKEDE